MTLITGSRRQIQAAETRRALLHAARDLFVSRGFHNTSITDIAGEAHASKGTVYHHFTDKWEIFAEVFEASQREIMDSALKAAVAGDSSWERLELATRAFLHSYVVDPDAGTLLGQALKVLGWERVQELDETISLPHIRAELEEFQAQNEMVNLDTETTSQLILGLYCQAVLVVTGSNDPAIDVDTLTTTILAMLHGLKSSDS